MKRKTIPELDELDDSRSHSAPTIPAFRKPSTSIAFLPKEARRPSLFLFFLSSYSLLEHPMPTRSMTLLRASLLAAILSPASVLLVSCGEIRAFSKAAEADTIPAYREYLEAYPSGSHADDVYRRVEEGFYRHMVKERTPDSFDRYLKEYPSGDRKSVG